MNIGIDLDEVVGDTMSALTAFHNGRYGTALKREDFHSYMFHEIWGGTPEEAIQKMYEFFETDHFSSINPVFGSLGALKRIKELGHKIFLITGREGRVVKATEAWIEKNFPDVFDGLHFASSYGPTAVRRKKSDICKELKVTLLVEDDLLHARDCSEAGITTLLFDQPWNRGAKELPHVKRVYSWDEIVDIVAANAIL